VQAGQFGVDARVFEAAQQPSREITKPPGTVKPAEISSPRLAPLPPTVSSSESRISARSPT
jgi:hypothetical protein